MTTKFHRLVYDKIKERLFQEKIIILYGARRTGKTTLCKELIGEFGDDGKYFNCENLETRTALEAQNPQRLREFLGQGKLFILDEAQNVNNIGQSLKLLIDNYPEIQIIATGSSSFDLANKTGEPLVGRAFTLTLHPLSIAEISNSTSNSQAISDLSNQLRFGMMPHIYNLGSTEQKIEELQELASRYLYKDILELEDVRSPRLLNDLLRALALQVGQEVSLRELAGLLNVAHTTIDRYLDLLEKTFVIYRLRSFSRNLRKELGKSFKVYFWDLGIRNSLLINYNEINNRTDTGALWENFCITERLKKNSNERRFVNTYFWRTYDQKEIDYIEESNGELHAFEFKFNKKQSKPPTEFLETYTSSDYLEINRENYFKFLK
jgi:uncharacterized protein